MSLDTTRSVPVGDLVFDVREEGPADAPAVLLLHGFPETSASWTEVGRGLVDAGLRVIAPDQRGYSPGARPEAVEAYTMETLAGDVLALADALGIDRFHLVGHDWGSAVAWCVAAWHPGRLLSLTALSVPHLAAYNAALAADADAQERASYIGLFRQEGKAEHLLLDDDAARLRAMFGGVVDADRVEVHVRHLQEPGALTAALAWYRAMTAELGGLPTVDVPTTFVWSDDDMAIGRAGADACGHHVSADYRYVVLEGISHWIPEQAPEAAVEAVLTRIASVSS